MLTPQPLLISSENGSAGGLPAVPVLGWPAVVLLPEAPPVTAVVGVPPPLEPAVPGIPPVTGLPPVLGFPPLETLTAPPELLDVPELPTLPPVVVSVPPLEAPPLAVPPDCGAPPELEPPLDEAPGPHFALTAKIARRNGLRLLSMGMSTDFSIAIALGATHVRVGTARFGTRG